MIVPVKWDVSMTKQRGRKGRDSKVYKETKKEENYYQEKERLYRQWLDKVIWESRTINEPNVHN